MLPNSEFTYIQSQRFFALASRSMSDQSTYLLVRVNLLFTELAGQITFDQVNQFKNLINLIHFLRAEIIDCSIVHDATFKLLHQRMQVTWDKVNVYSVIKDVVEHNSLLVKDFPKIVTVDTNDNEVTIYSQVLLLGRAISHFLIWIHLLAPSHLILVNLEQTETEVTLKLLKPDSSLDAAEKEISQFFKVSVEFLVSILGGSFNWKIDQIIPDEDELVIHLPKKFPQ